jgi:hypothetical protein
MNGAADKIAVDVAAAIWYIGFIRIKERTEEA